MKRTTEKGPKHNASALFVPPIGKSSKILARENSSAGVSRKSNVNSYCPTGEV